MSEMPLLSVKDLSIGLERTPRQYEDSRLVLTENISFDIQKGQTFALVGESGCGKSVSASAIMGGVPGRHGKRFTGEVIWKGTDMATQNEQQWSKVRGTEMAMIFQEPGAAMNPLMTVAQQMEECFTLHQHTVDQQRILELLNRVGFSDPHRVLSSYPHELSGGMLQRVMIAMSLSLKPELLIADEPTTALDVTVQAQVMELLKELQRETGTAILLITHNLGLVAQYADRMGVMYAGRLVETSSVTDFFKQPSHPYAQGLLKALPGYRGKGLEPIAGQVPPPSQFVEGCRFAPRCSKASSACEEKPEWQAISQNHHVSCFHAQQKDDEP
jgi:oligopeptide/dipeptide ABC transporter ATP-binding protein